MATYRGKNMDSVFNFFMTYQQLFRIAAYSFIGFFSFRQLCIKRLFFTFTYYSTLSFLLFIAAVTGGGVQNDGYVRLEKFVALEASNQLEHAKNNPENYDGMFQIDLEQFKNSAEFRKYLHTNDAAVDKAEAMSLGFLFTLFAEFSLLLVAALRRLWRLYLMSKQKVT